jgi:hypothetical protein
MVLEARRVGDYLLAIRDTAARCGNASIDIAPHCLWPRGISLPRSDPTYRGASGLITLIMQ